MISILINDLTREKISRDSEHLLLRLVDNPDRKQLLNIFSQGTSLTWAYPPIHPKDGLVGHLTNILGFGVIYPNPQFWIFLSPYIYRCEGPKSTLKTNAGLQRLIHAPPFMNLVNFSFLLPFTYFWNSLVLQ